MRDFDREAGAQPGKKYNYEFDSIVRHYMMREFKSHFGDGPALELGSYHGDSTIELSKYFPDVTVIEASAAALAIAQSRVSRNVKFINSLMEDPKFERPCSSICLINTREHMEDARATLNRVKGWLSESGK